MVRARHARRVGIPRQQVERRRLFSAHVIIDDIGPDQIVGPQHVEGIGHHRAVEITDIGHMFLDAGDRRLVREDGEFAGLGEVRLRREQCRAGNAGVAFRGHPGERHRQHRPADAIADRGDVARPCRLLDRAERGQHSFVKIVREPLVGVARIRIDPGDHEDRQALIDHPAHVALRGIEIKNVELVDPWRHDQHRSRKDLRRRRRILQQLDEIVAEHDLARRRRHVAPEFEFCAVGLAQAQLAMTRLYVCRQKSETADKVLAVALHRRLQQFRIGQQEIRRRRRARDLPEVEGRLRSRMWIETLAPIEAILRPLRRDRMRLPQEVEEGLVPLGGGETFVGFFTRNERFLRLAGEPLQRVRPQIDHAAGELRLCLDELFGLA